MHNKAKWRFSQPNLGEEIVIFVNHSKPSFHIVFWKPQKSLGEFYNNDWDICLSPGVFVGPRSFEGGVHFIESVKDKEFYWMPKKSFLKVIP